MEYIENKKKGHFMTKKPYNDDKWELSPWHFVFVIDPETGNFICELSHRMTNNRIYGWDKEGNELSSRITDKYFRPHF